MSAMDTTTLDTLTRRYRRAETALDEARAALATEVVRLLAAHDERGAQAEIARRTGWSREQVRQVVKAAAAKAREGEE
ncbi:hypothetical protein [Streptomyces sp. NPDC048659]|uniref:hypothetical protein n=1 Tax=Streptomyces sp. NPDC048659 TaxID=3155489 RepID=UPI0034296D34